MDSREVSKLLLCLIRQEYDTITTLQGRGNIDE
jgi:hypothetical protein